MTDQAVAPDHIRSLRCKHDPASRAMLKPCRFCGRADMLTFHDAYDVRLSYDGDRLARSGADVLEETYDAVKCHSCCVTAPYDVWQAERDVYSPRQRQAYRDYLDGWPMALAERLEVDAAGATAAEPRLPKDALL